MGNIAVQGFPNFCRETGRTTTRQVSVSIVNTFKSVSNYTKSINAPFNYGELGDQTDASASERNFNIIME
jgi:hypothetical protein